MPSSFIAASALSAIYDRLAGVIDFKLILDVSGTINAVKTAAVTFYLQNGSDVIEKEVLHADLLKLIKLSTDGYIIYSIPVTVTPPETLLFWAVEHDSNQVDTTIPRSGNGNIKIYGKPDLPRIELLTKVIDVSGVSVNLAGTIVRIHLSQNDGGAPLQNLNILLLTKCEGVDSAATNILYSILAADIAAGFYDYTLLAANVGNLVDGTILAFRASVDNTGGQQSKLSIPLLMVATMRPVKPSFTVSSGKVDGVAVYLPLKIVADINTNNWDRINILTYASNTYTVADHVVRSPAMESEIASKGFFEHNLLYSASGTALTPFTMVELNMCASTGAYTAAGKSSQSALYLVNKKAVTGDIKNVTSSSAGVLSTYTALSGAVAAFHTFTQISTFTASAGALQYVAKLHQNGAIVDSKVGTIAIGATSVTNTFDRLASLVASSDNFKIVITLNRLSTASFAEYLPETNAVLKIAEFESKEVSPKPFASDIKTLISFISVDDVKVSGGKRGLLAELKSVNNEISRYEFLRCEMEMASDQAFGTKLKINSAAGVTMKTIPVVGKHIDGIVPIVLYDANSDIIDFLQNTHYYIRVRAVQSWFGADSTAAAANKEVVTDWITSTYLTQAADSVAAPAAPTIIQKNVKSLECAFAKAVPVTWSGDGLIGTKVNFSPVLHIFKLYDETNTVIATKNISHDDMSKASLITSFDLDDSKLDQYVRVTYVRQYKNEDNKIILSDMTASADRFLDKPLSIKSIKAVETLTTVKVEVELDFGRTDAASIEVKLIIPYVDSSSADKYITAALTRIGTTYSYETSTPLTKQTDAQATKYGASLVIYAIATGPFGTIVRRLPL